MTTEFGGGDEIRFERRGQAGIVTLTRPKALNAVTHNMVKALSTALTAWEADPAVAAVIIKGEGRAFSAGGDIVHVYHEGRKGNPPVDFFADEYRLNAQIARFRKPYVALIDGIVMGGGVGLSFHGSHRVMTENAQFAMPEVGIGFFPDVGGSHILPELGENFGFYAAVTGNRVRYGDALWSGLATHTVKSEYLAGIEERIAETGDADLALREAFAPAHRETEDSAVRAIAHHFSHETLDGVLASLKAASATDAFAARTLETMLTRSPTSLRVTFRQIREGQGKPMDDCMRMEFRIVNRMLAGHDFYEGIRAALIDKGDTPRWSPKRVEDVDDAAVAHYFEPLGDKELTL